MSSQESPLGRAPLACVLSIRNATACLRVLSVDFAVSNKALPWMNFLSEKDDCSNTDSFISSPATIRPTDLSPQRQISFNTKDVFAFLLSSVIIVSDYVNKYL